MRVQNPLDDLFAVTDLIERGKRTAKPIPGLSSLINDSSTSLKAGRYKAEFVMGRGVKQSGFLRHQSAESQKQDGYAAGQRLIGRKRAGFGQNEIGSGDEAMNVLNESERTRFRMTRGLEPMPQSVIAAADDEDVRIRCRSSRRRDRSIAADLLRAPRRSAESWSHCPGSSLHGKHRALRW